MGYLMVAGLVVIFVLLFAILTMQITTTYTKRQRGGRPLATKAVTSIDPAVKMTALSFQNAPSRLGFNVSKFYNDFIGEGHMYPLHGGGDFDNIRTLLKSVHRSAIGLDFELKDLGISVRTIDKSILYPNSFFDFHVIPTKHLDGSAKLPDGSRPEHRIPSLSPLAGKQYPRKNLMRLDPRDGLAYFIDSANEFGYDVTFPFKTTLHSARQTPFLAQDDHLALFFFADGNQARLNNGGELTNYRYLVPASYKTTLTWVVAKAYVPCKPDEFGAELLTPTSGGPKWCRPRRSEETEDLNKIAYNQNRLMKVVSAAVPLTKTEQKVRSFQQRYGGKITNFGSLWVKSNALAMPAANGLNFQDVHEVYTYHQSDLQIAFNEMLKLIAGKLGGRLPPPYQVVSPNTLPFSVWSSFKDQYLNDEYSAWTVTALNTRSQLRKTYVPSTIGDTGWMVVGADAALPVPEDEGGYFAGWAIKTAPPEQNVISKEKENWLHENDYALHQGPGIFMQTSGNFAHHGAQEPYLLEQNMTPQRTQGEDQIDFENRIQQQLPTVHWRLDSPRVILSGLKIGSVIETNVAAGQRMLFTVGTKTPNELPSRSQNFLGALNQNFLGGLKSDLHQKIKSLNLEGLPYEITSFNESH